jgi:hypothetical protein
MPRVRHRAVPIGIVAALLALTVVPSVSPADSSGPTVTVNVGGPLNLRPIAPGFIGTSTEFWAVKDYTGRDPNHINPVLVQLLRNLAAGGQPVLRIGGNSTDQTWWPMKGVIPGGGVKYGLTNGWLRTTKALAQALNAKLILGVNLADGQPALAAAEARAFIQGIGRQYIDAIEIGNEPDVYGQFAWYRAPDGRVFFSRRSTYSLSDFEADFARWRAALPVVPLAGPATAELVWLSGLDNFISAESNLSVVTLHRYALRGCNHTASSPLFPSIPNLLSDASSQTLAQNLAPYVAVADAHAVPFRVDELNSASCGGVKGLSDTFASALWALDTLFNLASVGVDGVNIHTFPNAGYELFSFRHTGNSWQAFVHPEYYGLLAFDRAAPPGSRLLYVAEPGGPIKVWATQSAGNVTHVVVINKSPTAAQTVQIHMLGGATSASLEWLQAPSATATDGVTLGGQTFGNATSTGGLGGTLRTAPLDSFLDAYQITMPPASAVILTQG